SDTYRTARYCLRRRNCHFRQSLNHAFTLRHLNRLFCDSEHQYNNCLMNTQFYRQLIFDVDNALTLNEKQMAMDALIRYVRSLLDDEAIVEEKVRSGKVTIEDLRTIDSIQQLREQILEKP